MAPHMLQLLWPSLGAELQEGKLAGLQSLFQQEKPENKKWEQEKEINTVISKGTSLLPVFLVSMQVVSEEQKADISWN